MNALEEAFFKQIDNLGIAFKDRLNYPIRTYFKYKTYPSIPVFFIGEMNLDEDIRSAITNIQAKTIGF
jgi:hypothetical protein